MDSQIVSALTGYAQLILPEIILAVTACVLFLAATWNISHRTAAVTALIGVGAALLALYFSAIVPMTGWGVLALLLAVLLFGMTLREGKPLWLGTGFFGCLMLLLTLDLAASGALKTVEGRNAQVREQKKRLSEAAPADKEKPEQVKLKETIEAEEGQLRAIAYSCAAVPQPAGPGDQVHHPDRRFYPGADRLARGL